MEILPYHVFLEWKNALSMPGIPFFQIAEEDMSRQVSLELFSKVFGTDIGINL
jgi:hypothetical protein